MNSRLTTSTSTCTSNLFCFSSAPRRVAEDHLTEAPSGGFHSSEWRVTGDTGYIMAASFVLRPPQGGEISHSCLSQPRGLALGIRSMSVALVVRVVRWKAFNNMRNNWWSLCSYRQEGSWTTIPPLSRKETTGGAVDIRQ